MVLTVILTLTGIILGASTLGLGGWLAGGIMGYLLAQVLQLSGQIKKLEQAVNRLQQPASRNINQAPATVAAAPIASAPAAEPQADMHPTSELPDPDITEPTSPITMQPLDLLTPSAPPFEPVPAIPLPPRVPDLGDKAIALVKDFFTQGNPIVRVGMVVMFFGMSFLVKYAASEGFIPLELRLAVVALIALALVAIGWKTRAKEGGYGLVLQGGGIAALYLTVFAALKLYSVLPPGFAFVLMVAMVMLGAALAILQNAQTLALVATAGGFLAPILTSDGSGSHVALFSFYLLLNIGILTIALFKSWRMLNWVGFIFTFVITSIWGVLEYNPEFYPSTQPFLLAFFALYLAVSILFSIRQSPNLTGLIDGTLVFGLPVVAFGLQTALLKHTEYGLAISAVVLSAVYIALARVLWAKLHATHRLLIESFIALGVTFATLAIPLALDAEWTSATWALEATGLIWVGLQQQRLLPRLAGYLLHVGAAVSLLRYGAISAGDTPIVSGDFLSLFVLSVSALCIAHLLSKFQDLLQTAERPMALVALIIGWVWWLIAGVNELAEHSAPSVFLAAVILFFALSCAAFAELSRKLNSPLLAHTGFWLLPLAAVFIAGNFLMEVISGNDFRPLSGWGWLAIAMLIAAQYRFLWYQQLHPRQWLITTHHVGSVWFMLVLLFGEALWWQGHNAWHGTSALALWFACIAVPLVLLMQISTKHYWPFAQNLGAYKSIIPAPLLFFLLLWFIAACSYSGATGFRYIPVLNPLDLLQFAAIIVLAYSIKRDLANLGQTTPEIRFGILGCAGFLWLNVLIFRGVHHYSDVPYALTALWHTPVVQMSLSILWSLCALVVMNIARRRQQRKLWMVGAVLLGLVVFKLFTLDISGAGTLARVVSFMAVGVLILLIGYLSPMPAKKPGNEEAAR